MGEAQGRSIVKHYASFWRCFHEAEEAKRVTIWRVMGGSRLASAASDDILWLFTDGRKCRSKLDDDELPVGGVVDSLGYLAEVFTIRRVVRHKFGIFELRADCIDERSARLCPPLIIDDIVRPAGHAKEKQIGSLRQGAWMLREDVADQLCARLRRDAPEAYYTVFGES